MPAAPVNHVQDAQKLTADAKIPLYQMLPASGGTVYFKPDNDITWLGQLYEGLPCELSGEKYSADVSTPTPRLSIGQEQVDLLPFKGLIHDGMLDGAKIIRHKVLLADLLANNNVKETTEFRVKRIENYNRNQIILVLSTYSGASNQTFPHRQYTPPAFPWVRI